MKKVSMKKFKYEDKQKFSNDVESYILETENSVSYIEAVLETCDRQKIEPDVAAKLLTQPIIEKIEAEGKDFNLLPRGAKLPL